MRVVGVDDGGSARTQREDRVRVLGGHFLHAGHEFLVLALRVVDDRDRRLRDRAQLARLAAMVHAEFDHGRAMRLAQAQQAQRQSDRVVEIALRGQHGGVAVVRAEDRRDHFLHRRLAVAADDDRQRDVELAAPERREAAERRERIRRPRSGRPQASPRDHPQPAPRWRLARARRRRTRVRRSVRPAARRRDRRPRARGCRSRRAGSRRCRRSAVRPQPSRQSSYPSLGSPRRQRGSGHGGVGEWRAHAVALLVRLVALAGDEHDVAGFRRADRAADRLRRGRPRSTSGDCLRRARRARRRWRWPPDPRCADCRWSPRRDRRSARRRDPFPDVCRHRGRRRSRRRRSVRPAPPTAGRNAVSTFSSASGVCA